MLAEFTPEFPTSLRDQVTCLLAIYHPKAQEQWKTTVRVCLEQLEGHPFGDKLSKSVKTLEKVVGCTLELLGDAVTKQKINPQELGAPIPIGLWLAENIIIPAVEKDTFELFESKLNLGENPFIPKPVEPPPVVINHHVIRNRLEMCMN